jgi:hypothetical protein
MTTCPLTHHPLFHISRLPKTLQWFPPPPFGWPGPPRLFPVPQDEITAERAWFWHDWGDPCRIASGYRHIWELAGMHEMMGNTLGSLYTCQRGLLRKRRWKLGVTVGNFFNGQIPRSFGLHHVWVSHTTVKFLYFGWSIIW